MLLRARPAFFCYNGRISWTEDLCVHPTHPKIPRGRSSIWFGTYSALEWILERYKEKKPKDPTIAEKFNTYRFADYKEQVIELLMRACTVSVETMKIVKEMTE